MFQRALIMDMSISERISNSADVDDYADEGNRLKHNGALETLGSRGAPASAFRDHLARFHKIGAGGAFSKIISIVPKSPAIDSDG